MRCLICNGPHRAIECPTRNQVGAHGNGAVVEEHVNGFAMGVDIEVSSAFAVGNFFVAEDIYGYAIVDTGATKSMSSFKQMEWLQDLLCGIWGEDVMGRAPANVRFHFAGGGEATTSAANPAPNDTRWRLRRPCAVALLAFRLRLRRRLSNRMQFDMSKDSG